MDYFGGLFLNFLVDYFGWIVLVDHFDWIILVDRLCLGLFTMVL